MLSKYPESLRLSWAMPVTQALWLCRLQNLFVIAVEKATNSRTAKFHLHLILKVSTAALPLFFVAKIGKARSHFKFWRQ